MNPTETAIPPRVSPLRHRFLVRFRNPIFAEIIYASSLEGFENTAGDSTKGSLNPWRPAASLVA